MKCSKDVCTTWVMMDFKLSDVLWLKATPLAFVPSVNQVGPGFPSCSSIVTLAGNRSTTRLTSLDLDPYRPADKAHSRASLKIHFG